MSVQARPKEYAAALYDLAFEAWTRQLGAAERALEHDPALRGAVVDPQHDVPHASDALILREDLDEHGIVREGTVVRTGDILVGKITPRGESEPTPEEKIFRSIFGERARNVRNTSLRMHPVAGGPSPPSPWPRATTR